MPDPVRRHPPAHDIFEVKLGATGKVDSRVNVWGEVGKQYGENG